MSDMIRILAVLILSLLVSPARAQCNGVFGSSTVCGTVAGGPPGPIPFSSIASGAVNSGTANQVTFYSATGSTVSGSTLTIPIVSGSMEMIWPVGTHLNGPILCNGAGGGCPTPGVAATQVNHSLIVTDGGTWSGTNLGGQIIFGLSPTTNGHLCVIFGFTGNCNGDGGVTIGSNGSVAQSNDSVIQGNDNSSSGNNVVIGTGATNTGSAANSVVIGGSGTTNNSTDSVVIGNASSNAAGGIFGIAIGSSAVLSGAANAEIAIGSSAAANGTNDMAIGASASTSTSNGNNIALGPSASATTSDHELALGVGATVSAQFSIAIGDGATTSTTKHMVLGGPQITDAYAGTETGGAVAHADGFQATGTTYAARPTNTAGRIVYITDGLAANCGDGTCTTWGTTITGGTGALKLLAWFNGTSLTLIGK